MGGLDDTTLWPLLDPSSRMTGGLTPNRRVSSRLVRSAPTAVSIGPFAGKIVLTRAGWPVAKFGSEGVMLSTECTRLDDDDCCRNASCSITLGWRLQMSGKSNGFIRSQKGGKR